jgi:hypothetical protein
MRRLPVAAIVALAIAASPAFQAMPAQALGGGGGVTIGKGFDACTAPSTSAMNAWWSGTPWTWVGVYIGGDSRACSQPNLTATWLNAQFKTGWRFEFLWVGPQAPCTTFGNRISSSTSTAFNQGVAQAQQVFTALTNLGVGNNAQGTPVIYDMEAFDTSNSGCVAAVRSFVNGWVQQLHVAPAQVAGYYGSTCGSDVDAMASIAHVPDYINGADFDGNSSTKVMACVSSSHWVSHQRLKQYQGGHNETWNGVTLNIDSNCANGPLAPSATNFNNTACL